MKKALTAFSMVLGLAIAALFAQNPNGQPVNTPQVNLPMSVGIPLPPQAAGPASVVGATGNTTYYFWLVSEFPVGNSSLSGPFPCFHAPQTLTSSNYCSLSWNAVNGASSYDVLLTTTQVQPGPTCTCAVTIATTNLNANAQSNTLSSYTVNTFNPQIFSVSLTNESVGTSTHLMLRRQPGNSLIADLSGAVGVATLSPSGFSFGNVQQGTTSPATSFSLNVGSGSTPIGNITASLVENAPGAGDFSLNNQCPSNLNSGGCTILTACNPQAAGNFSATLFVYDTALASPQTATMSCTGIASTGPGTVTGIIAQPSNPSVQVGGTVQENCFLTFSSGPNQSLPNCPWNSSSTGNATVSASGLITGVAATSSPITVTPNSGVFQQATSKVFVSGQSGGSGTPQVQTSLSGNLRCLNNSGATCTETTAVALTPGWQLLIYVTGSGATACTVSDANSGVNLDTFVDAGPGFTGQQEVYVAKNGTTYGTLGGTAVKISASCTGAGTIQAQGIAISGASNTAPFDPTPTLGGTVATGTGTTISGSAITANNNSLVLQIGYSNAGSETCLSGTNSIFVLNGGSETRGCQQNAPANAGTQTLTQSVTSGAWTAWTFGFTAGTQTPTTSLAVTLSNPIAQGQTLAVVVEWGDATATLTTGTGNLTDSCGNTLTLQNHIQASGLSQFVYYILASAACPTDIITANWTSTGALNPNIIPITYTGLLAFDISAQACGTSASPQATQTPGQAADFAIGFTEIAGTTTNSSYPTGVTARATDSLSDSGYDLPVFSTSSVTPGPTLAASKARCDALLLFNTATQTGASVTVAGTQTGPYTIQNQEPITLQQYAGSIFTTPLPGTADSHCLGNVTCSSSSPDKAIINCIFGGNCSTGTGGSETNAAFQRIAYDPPDASGGGTGASGTYYSTCADPIYKITGLNFQLIPPANNPLNLYFHIKNQAQFGNGVGGDNYLFNWDQCTDNSAGNTVAGGRRLTDYEYTGAAGVKALPPCTCTTETCANNTASCQLQMNYADYAYPLNDNNAIGEGEAYVSIGAASHVGLIRGNELAAGVISHAIFLNAYCNNGQAVFPSVSVGGKVALTCGNTTNRPSPGALFKISNSFNCSAVTPKEVRAICFAMQTYGGYLTDTCGAGCAGSPVGVFPSRFEGGAAYSMVGIPMPGLQALGTDANGSTVQCSSNTINSTPAFCSVQAFNLSGLVTANNLEIIDPCIPLFMANKAGACTP